MDTFHTHTKLEYKPVIINAKRSDTTINFLLELILNSILFGEFGCKIQARVS